MSNNIMKCYRCNLDFNNETHATLHEEISGHSVRREWKDGKYSKAFKYVVRKLIQ